MTERWSKLLQNYRAAVRLGLAPHRAAILAAACVGTPAKDMLSVVGEILSVSSKALR